MIFLGKYIFYAKEKQIQERIKKIYQQNMKTLRKYKKQPKQDMYQLFIDQHKRDKEKEQIFKQSDHEDI